ncbi:MAG: phosphoenolpyruvate synthase [Myxococcales bacterium]|nr:phosphoenolpyruvate synthase [Myxococcales bacterium]
MTYVLPLRETGIADVARVGGKNASLGEMLRELGGLGVRVPDGFAITADGYRYVLAATGVDRLIGDVLAGLRRDDVVDLTARATRIRDAIVGVALPADLVTEVVEAYRAMGDVAVAVRSSATAEDLPGASFAGQQESFLHVRGEASLLDAVKRCFASLFTARAISYRVDMGFGHLDVALSVGVQRMVRADRAAAGVIFTLDPESGFRDVVLITSAWGLGENVVQGRVRPDELYVHKPTLQAGARSLVWKRVGSKEQRMVYDPARHRLVNEPVPTAERRRLSLSDDDALTLARWALIVEAHYSEVRGAPTPMDLEWAKDGETGELFVVQARPETVHGRRGAAPTIRMWHLEGKAPLLGEGIAVGTAIGAGRARVVASPRAIAELVPGEVLVTAATDPDWEPVMKLAAAIVTERGGRTSHAAIVARELGIPAVVGVDGAMTRIPPGQEITVSCAEGETGRIYAGRVPCSVEDVAPGSLPALRTRIMMNLAHPDRAFQLAQLPCDGVGLARMEFIFASWVGVHPLALTRYAQQPYEVRRQIDEVTGGATDQVEFFVDRLSQGIAVLAAAFWPRQVILRFSDFKTNEYARLIGGAAFEPTEANPMLGWRGASRYYHPEFRDGFLLECAAVRRVRETMGLTNLDVMIPFCRTVAEGARVLEVAAGAGLGRTPAGPRWYVMAEIPSNILCADRFAELFDGFSIGSNDLTQLMLGVDRDSPRVAPLFDERDEAVKRAFVMLIERAHAAGRTVGICGQAPSDYPELAAFLVQHGIDSLSLTPDAVVPTWRRVAAVEARGR